MTDGLQSGPTSGWRQRTGVAIVVEMYLHIVVVMVVVVVVQCRAV